MRLVRFGQPGAERPGLIDAAGRVRDLSFYLPEISGAQLDPALLQAVAAIDSERLPLAPPDARLGPCVARPGKIVCVGLNYRSLAATAGMPLPREPVIFLKATSALCGPADALRLPAAAQQVDWEVELAVVIGRGGRNIAAAQALDHVAGYAVFNDLSERAWQFGASGGPNGSHNGGQWDKGKHHDGFAPLGPWLVTADEIADPHQLDLWLDVDGQRMQAANTGDMLFTIPELIAEISRYMGLDAGDVIATGTPPGSAFLQGPLARYLRPGQTVRAGIAGLGAQCRAVLAGA
ncbi:MAG TPA: fumarylacetoacetate hydrolase family protein [Rhodocyclaceae bacterium]